MCKTCVLFLETVSIGLEAELRLAWFWRSAVLMLLRTTLEGTTNTGILKQNLLVTSCTTRCSTALCSSRGDVSVSVSVFTEQAHNTTFWAPKWNHCTSFRILFNPCMKYVKYVNNSRLLKDTKTTALIFSLYLLTMCDCDEIFNCVADKCHFLNCFCNIWELNWNWFVLYQ